MCWSQKIYVVLEVRIVVSTYEETIAGVNIHL